MGGDPAVGRQHSWRPGVVGDHKPVMTVVATRYGQGPVESDPDLRRVQLSDPGIVGVEVQMPFRDSLRVAQIANRDPESWEPAMKL